jgi:hypothetical protein
MQARVNQLVQTGHPAASAQRIAELEETLKATTQVAEQAVFGAIGVLTDARIWYVYPGARRLENVLCELRGLATAFQLDCDHLVMDTQERRSDLAEGSYQDGAGKAATVHSCCGYQDPCSIQQPGSNGCAHPDQLGQHFGLSPTLCCGVLLLNALGSDRQHLEACL